MRRTVIGALILVLAVTWLGAVAGGAAAAGAVASWSERQMIPGLTERTIWGRDQVYVYRLPRNVTHTGDLHVELTYTPADRDCFVYLLGPVAKGSLEWQVCPGTYGQGFLSQRPGPRSRRLRGARGARPGTGGRGGARRRVLRGRAGGERRLPLPPHRLPAAHRRRQRRHDLRGDLHARLLPGAGQGERHHQRGRGSLRRPVRLHADLAGPGRVPPPVPGRRRRADGRAGLDRRWRPASSSTSTRPCGSRRTAPSR